MKIINSLVVFCPAGISATTFIVFLVLKFCEVIDWSWLWITAPLWISTLIIFSVTVWNEIAMLRLKIKKQKEQVNEDS